MDGDVGGKAIDFLWHPTADNDRLDPGLLGEFDVPDGFHVGRQYQDDRFGRCTNLNIHRFAAVFEVRRVDTYDVHLAVRRDGEEFLRGQLVARRLGFELLLAEVAPSFSVHDKGD